MVLGDCGGLPLFWVCGWWIVLLGLICDDGLVVC